MRRTGLGWLVALLLCAVGSCLEWQLELRLARAEIAGANRVLLQIAHTSLAGLQANRHPSSQGRTR
jgi:hypothetical protein